MIANDRFRMSGPAPYNRPLTPRGAGTDMPTNLEVKAKLTNKERAIEAAKQLSNSQGILLVSFKQTVHHSIYV